MIEVASIVIDIMTLLVLIGVIIFIRRLYKLCELLKTSIIDMIEIMKGKD